VTFGLKDAEIGGGVVRRRFNMTVAGAVGVVSMIPGARLTAEQILAMPIGNRRGLVRMGHIDVFPKTAAPPEAERHIVHNGGGRYDVIAGVKLNDRVLDREEAEELATRPGN
jgi:hypothetical protein